MSARIWQDSIQINLLKAALTLCVEFSIMNRSLMLALLGLRCAYVWFSIAMSSLSDVYISSAWRRLTHVHVAVVC